MRKKKLIRDNIPEIAEKNGDILKTYIANEKEYEDLLFEKLLEEAQEVIEEKENMEKLKNEVGDLLEVLDAIYELKGLNLHEILDLKMKKGKKNGYFKKKLILEY
ncbi:phosphoribosyl-ATP pyrophosphohydrolase [Candidatus Gracilibacteria bacterium]|nr:MAG: phosphoribosyl-ATP pyrophosphohydrolase [Candidatus Gracilibacteria bacterium]